MFFSKRRSHVHHITKASQIPYHLWDASADALPAKAREVLVSTPTLLVYHAGRRALVGSLQDFEADALWRRRCRRFGARPAPLSHVGIVALVLPAGAAPHPPNTHGIGH